MQSKATTVEQYLSELPADRRQIIDVVRTVILDNLDSEFEEGIQYGMIGYYVPHRIYPQGYHCDTRQPLPFAGLASQKNHISLYLMTVYGEGSHWQAFQDAWAKTGKKLDMGKCCIRFKKIEDVALEVIGDAINRVPARDYIRHYEASFARDRTGSTKSQPDTKSSPKAKASAKTPAAAPRSKNSPAKSAPKAAKKPAPKSTAKGGKSGGLATKAAGRTSAKKSPKQSAKKTTKKTAKK